MNALLAWVLLAAVVCVISCAANDPRAMTAMFAISILLPEDTFSEGV